MGRGWSMPERQEDRKPRELEALINSRKTITGIDDQEIAASIGMKPDTFRKKRKHPERFTYPEVIRLLAKLKATDEERLRVI